MDEDQVLNTTEFSWKELQRLIELIPQTDPTTHAYGTLLESIERYGAIMKFVDWYLSVKQPKSEPQPKPQRPTDIPESNIIQFTPPTSEAEKFEEPEPTPDPEPEEKDTTEYDPAVVKSLITKARADKKIPSAKAWIQENWGVDGFSAIPASKYSEVMAKLKELGVT